ncbi:MAG: S1C family serine protease [Treponema sp.]|jgi:S1-C subfamily serine protease|nr:S1C family serine protease [Treponema sp.]
MTRKHINGGLYDCLRKTGWLIVLVPVFFSCRSVAEAERRLAPPRSTSEFRLDDIKNSINDDPALAIHRIGIYKAIYGPEGAIPGNDGEILETLENLEETAVSKLKEFQVQAIEEERWGDAASLARSLVSLGIPVEQSGSEPEFVLSEAKKDLGEGKYLPAFLGAVQAHEELSFEDALLFLEHAVKAKQRRTAAFFLAATERLADGNEGTIQEEYRTYARGRDLPSDMIKGVATVIVDRGTRIERGIGFPDMVLGSAFFVDVSGLLITNYHVIESEVDTGYEGYSRMYVRMGSSSSPRIPAKVIGWDKAMDLALIKADFSPEYVFSVVDRSIPQVGDTVLAIGSPGGLEKTVTSGIVSALGRRFLQLGDVIQIDAAVNHGTSGGPVVDQEGRLVGIVFAGVEQYQGLNFAVPAERLAAALPSMIKGGKAERPWLGLTLSETVHGAEIIYVAPGTPAADQQVKEGVYIKSINNRTVTAFQGALITALQDCLFQLRPGELISLETSDGAKHTLMMAKRPDIPLAEAVKKDSRERLAAPLFGIILSPAMSKDLYFFDYLVKKVVRGSIAYEAGLSENDPISIRGFQVEEKDGYAVLNISVKKRRSGYLQTFMQLPALLDSPDTL